MSADKDNSFQNCVFLPLNFLDEVKEQMSSKSFDKFINSSNRCKRSLLDLQEERTILPRTRGHFSMKFHYHNALQKAICSHDWDRLLLLLNESPIWEHRSKLYHELDNWIRALIILLMYHPTAKAQGLFHQYLHMVVGCRSDEDKKAMTKILLTVPDKVIKRSHFYKYAEDD